jgi:hypothetical protein
MQLNVTTFINNLLLTCRAVRLGVLHGEHKRQCECGFECDPRYEGLRELE